MKGAILEKRELYFTYLKHIFFSLNNIQENYNWLITDYECYPEKQEYINLFSEEYCWMSGDELTKIAADEDFQWIWGVFSAFPKELTKEEILKYPLPQCDGYTGFWNNPVSMQHPLAEMEIVAWDSSLTIFISKDDTIIDTVMYNNALAENLEIYNIKSK